MNQILTVVILFTELVCHGHAVLHDHTAVTVAGKEAYVTILWTGIKDESYREGFEIGVRVLGQSLKESGTKREMIVLCTPEVPETTRQVLSYDGWTVKMINGFKNAEVANHFKAFILKLQVWLLTEYHRIIFLDSDALVVQNIDELFRCGSFCAVYRHTDLFNAGVMVLQPSLALYNSLTYVKCDKMMLNEKTKCEDQAILNNYYNDLKYSGLFNLSDSSYHEEPLRLPWIYNADIGMYYLNEFWQRPESDIKVYHYTLGPIKPMQWYTYPLFDLNWKWNEYRERLPYRFNEPSLYRALNLIPVIGLPLLILIVRSKYLKCCKWSFILLIIRFVHKRHTLINKLFPIVAQTISYIAAFYCVPTTMRPKEGWIIYGVWVMFIIAIQYLFYCSILLVSFEGLDGQYTRQPLMRRVRCKIATYFGSFCLLYILQISILFNVSTTIGIHSLLMLMIMFGIFGYAFGYFAGICALKIVVAIHQFDMLD